MAKGDWAEAYRLAQGDKSEAGAGAHAYLHRIEGDGDNAGYWYRRAGKPPGEGTPDAGMGRDSLCLVRPDQPLAND